MRDVDIHLLMQPGHVRQARRYLEAAKASIKYFGLWYGRYPYRDPHDRGPGVRCGGVRRDGYPTFITGGTTRCSTAGRSTTCARRRS